MVDLVDHLDFLQDLDQKCLLVCCSRLTYFGPFKGELAPGVKRFRYAEELSSTMVTLCLMLSSVWTWSSLNRADTGSAGLKVDRIGFQAYRTISTSCQRAQ